MTNLDDLSPAELQILIKEAQSKLEQKQNSMRKEVIGQIKELAASIGVTVDIIDDKNRSVVHQVWPLNMPIQVTLRKYGLDEDCPLNGCRHC